MRVVYAQAYVCVCMCVCLLLGFHLPFCIRLCRTRVKIIIMGRRTPFEELSNTHGSGDGNNNFWGEAKSLNSGHYDCLHRTKEK